MAGKRFNKEKLKDWIKNLKIIKRKIDNEDFSILRQTESAILVLKRAYNSLNNNKDDGVIVADDVGLGKTWVAIFVALGFYYANGKVLILAPNQQIQKKWKNEFKKVLEKFKDLFKSFIKFDENFCLKSLKIYEPISGIYENNILIGTHDKFSTICDGIKRSINTRKTQPVDLLIVDEAHRARHRNNSFNEKLETFNKEDKFRLFLTATPFDYKEKTFYNIIKLLKSNNKDVEDEKENGKKNKKISFFTLKEKDLDEYNFSQYKRSFEKLCELLKKYVIRHTWVDLSSIEKEEIGKCVHLLGNVDIDEVLNKENFCDEIIRKEGISPDINFMKVLYHKLRVEKFLSYKEKIYAPVAIETIISKSEDYKKFSFFPYSEHFENILEFKNISNPKLVWLKRIAKKLFEEKEKFIVFCYHHDVQKLLVKELSDIDILKKPKNYNISYEKDKKYVHVPYWINIKQKREVLERFNNGDTEIKALILTNEDSEGIDLHKDCRILIHYELSYTPIEIIQRNGRIRRIGCKASKVKKPILYFYPYLKYTRDEKLTLIALERANLFTKLMGGTPELNILNINKELENKLKELKAPSFKNCCVKKYWEKLKCL